MRECVVGEVGLIVEEEVGALFFAIIDIEWNGSIVDREGHNPGVVIIVTSDDRKVSLVNITDAIEVKPDRRI